MIDVTNNTSYNLGSPAKDGRSYYLNFGKHISATTEGSQLITKLIQSVDDSLFIDFARRFSNLIANRTIEKTYTKAMSHGHFDFLHWSRKILKDEYREAGLEVPKCFPETLYDDNAKIGKNKWRVFYINHYQDFHTDPSDSTMMSIGTNSFASKGIRHNNADVYMNLLPKPHVCTNTSNRTDEINLNRKNFFAWIKLDNQKFLSLKHQEHIKNKEQDILDRNKAKILAEKREQQLMHPHKRSWFNKFFHHK